MTSATLLKRLGAPSCFWCGSHKNKLVWEHFIEPFKYTPVPPEYQNHQVTEQKWEQ